MNEITHEIGDTVTTDNKESRLYKRECTVVFADKAMTGVITDGISEVIFIPTTDLTIKPLKKGEGYLTKETKAVLKDVMKQWSHKAFVDGLPRLIDVTRARMEMSPDNKVYVKMDGFVPRELAMAWKQTMSLLDMIKLTDENTVPYIQTLLFEWLLTGSLLALRATSELYDAQAGDGENEKK